jgi:MFS family permease
VLAVIQRLYPPPARPAALAALGAVLGLGGICGPLAGGLLIEADIAGWDWRAIFLINIPIGVLALVAARHLPSAPRGGRPTLDLAGALLAAFGLFGVVLPLVEGRQQGWPLWIGLILVVGVAVMGVFAWHERRVEHRGRTPMAPPHLFRQRQFIFGLATASGFYLALGPFLLFFVLTLQEGLHRSALGAGLATLPFALAAAASSASSGPAVARYGPRVITIGAALLTAGQLGLLATVHLAGTGLDPWRTTPAMLVIGIGFGLFLPPLTTVVLDRVPAEDAGAAAGVFGAVQQVAAALGFAVVGLLFFHLLAEATPDASGRPFLHALQPTLILTSALFALAMFLCQAMRLPTRRTPGDPTVEAADPARMQTAVAPQH